MNIAVLNTQIPLCRGGAEILAEDLVEELIKRGHNATLLTVPFKWYPQQSLIDNILACKLLDISDFNGVQIDKVIALKFPMWLMEHHNMSLWILHQHRTAYELWDTPYNDLEDMPDGHRVRELIIREDNLAIPKAQGIYTISRNVTHRLQQFNGIPSEVLYPPPRAMDAYRCDSYEQFYFYPSRITPLKRQELVIEALAYVSKDVKIVFAGQADDDSYLEKLKKRAAELNVADQITWLGHISEEEKIRLYAECLMVLFPSYNEDYGYVTPEGMLASKGVITLTDSGGSLEFVDHDVSGRVVAPEAEALGEELQRSWQNPGEAKLLGENARQKIQEMDISWDKVCDRLVGQ
jgi:glycosyltransferase involved in cell wall biosynthesis